MVFPGLSPAGFRLRYPAKSRSFRDKNSTVSGVSPRRINSASGGPTESCLHTILETLVAHILDSYGCRNYIIELGGEIVCKGQREQGGPWRIWIDKPEDGNNVSGALKQDVVSISDCGLVTSGNYRKFYVEDGRKYSHTVDPVSGMPVKHSLLSATVIARDGATADAYATWFMVIGTEEAKQVISSRLAGEGIEAYLVYGDQDDMKVWHTPGLLLDSERSK